MPQRGLTGGLFAILLLLTSNLSAATSDLADAAMKNDIHTIRSLLKQKADVNASQADGATALHWAAQWNDVQMVELLIRNGANVKVANRNGATAMTLACINGSAEMIAALLKAGADPNAPVLPNGETPLMMAARTGRPKAVQVLLDHGANVNGTESLRGTTPLMWAVSENNTDTARLLISRGAKVDVQSKINPLPPVRGRRGDSQGVRNGDGVTALIIAVRQRAIEALRLLLESGADVNQTAADHTSPLLVATLNGDYDLGKLLLERGADPNIANDSNWTPLYLAVKNRNIDTGVIPLPNASELPALEWIRMLLDKGANPNVRLITATQNRADNYPGWALNEAGSTPFLRAAVGGDVEVMRLLLAYGADPNIATNDNTTPLMAAAGLSWAQGFNHEHSEDLTVEAVKLLLNLGADVNAVRNDGAGALHGAAHKGANRVVALLAAHGADFTIRDKGGNQDGVKLIPLDYALGVTFTLTTTMAHADTADLIRQLMTERGIPIPETGPRSVGGDDGSNGRLLRQPDRKLPDAGR
jgi:ankyrin repeat protein